MLRGKKQSNDWGAGILAFPIAKQSKKALIAFKTEVKQSISIRVSQHFASLRFATRSSRQGCLRSSR
jgi:hypothetical protein